MRLPYSLSVNTVLHNFLIFSMIYCKVFMFLKTGHKIYFFISRVVYASCSIENLTVYDHPRCAEYILHPNALLLAHHPRQVFKHTKQIVYFFKQICKGTMWPSDLLFSTTFPNSQLNMLKVLVSSDSLDLNDS